LRLGRRLLGGLMAALMRLMRGLVSLVSALMRTLMGRLMDGLRCRRRRCGFRCLGAKAAMLELEQFCQRRKFGLQVLQPCFVLGSDLLHELLELSLVSVDLLFKEAGPVLQIPSYVTHLLAPR
jgi:hypothetical protein